MGRVRMLAAAVAVAASLSCAHNSGAGKPPVATPAPGANAPRVGAAPPRAAPPQAPPAAPPPAVSGAPGSPPGGPPGVGGRGGRVPLTPEQRAARRDSLSALRAQVVQELLTSIAGNENKRAGDVFKNIQLLKDTTAAQLLKTMDYYGKSLSVGCTFCHSQGGKWDEDTREAKKTARVMIELVDAINTGGLAKLPPNRNGQTPRISCLTCHRGNQTPGTALLP